MVIYTSVNEPYNKAITNYKGIKESINIIYDNLLATNTNHEFDDTINFLKRFIKIDEIELINLIKNANYISIYGKHKLIKKYIDKNKELSHKKLYLSEYLKLEELNIDEVRNLFINYTNLYVNLEGNDEAISIKELDATLNIIDEMVSKVKRFNFSPLEQLMYVYDKVRDRLYIKENINESDNISRDLTKVLLGNKIVCKGYANIFNAIIKRLGYKSVVYNIIRKELVNGQKIGHARNMVLLEDKKYDLNGIYFFDTTWDNKKMENDNSFLYSYKYFGKTKKEIESYKKGVYKDCTLPLYDERLVFIFSEIVQKDGIKHVPKSIIDTINIISRFVDNETLISPLMLISEEVNLPISLGIHFDYEEIMNKLISYDSLFDKSINAEILLKALYNVRKNEYYEEPDKYPFDIESLFKVVINSNWIFKNNASKLLMVIFGCEFSKRLIEETKINMKKFIQENELEKNIVRIKLTKTLRNLYSKRIEER